MVVALCKYHVSSVKKATNRALSKILQKVKAVLFLDEVKLQVHKTASKQGSLPYVPSVLF